MADVPVISPVILSGGSGTRLWPMSREDCPKQLIPLTSERSLLQETALRAVNGDDFAPPVVVCNAEHHAAVDRQLEEVGRPPRTILLEPVGRNTAPAAAVASMVLARDGQDALVLLLPSDHVISDTAAFHGAVRRAADAARGGALVTFGITPRRPETGYGYIHRGAPLNGDKGCYSVVEFVEKPDRATAQRYVASGDYSWNSGMFLFSARQYLEELERLEPAIVARCREAIERAETDREVVRLAADPFAACPSKSIDYAVMERTNRAAVVPADMGWSDVGSWAALWDEGRKDEAGNVTVGDVMAHDATGSYFHSDGPLIAALGVEDVVVVATADAVLVVPRDRAQDVRTVVDTLKSRRRPEAVARSRRPDSDEAPHRTQGGQPPNDIPG